MIVLKLKSDDSCNELLSKVRKMRMFAEDIEDCIEKSTEDTSYNESKRQSYDMDDSEPRMASRYYYPRR